MPINNKTFNNEECVQLANLWRLLVINVYVKVVGGGGVGAVGNYSTTKLSQRARINFSRSKINS